MICVIGHVFHDPQILVADAAKSIRIGKSRVNVDPGAVELEGFEGRESASGLIDTLAGDLWFTNRNKKIGLISNHCHLRMSSSILCVSSVNCEP